MLFLIVFLGIILLGGCSGIAYFPVHLATFIFSLIYLHKVSKYFLFWILLAFCFFFAQEPRFSLEYFLLASGFMAWGFSDWWLKLEENKKRIFLLTTFLAICIFHFIELEFSEHGSLLLWLPAFLVLYYPNPRAHLWVYGLSGIFLGLSAKVIAFIAYLAALLKNFQKRFLLLLLPLAGVLIFIGYANLNNFFEKSVFSRLAIWKSCFHGFLQRPFTGFGFGTFALDFSTTKLTSESWGSRADQFVAHGHSMLFHYLFELGIWGFLLFTALVFLVYKYAKPAFIPFIVVTLFDASLVNFSQILLASLLFVPYMVKDFELTKFQFKGLLAKITMVLALLISLYVQVPSLVGHYFFDKGNFNNAIQWDKQNSLYYLMRGFDYLNIDTVQSEKDFKTAVKLTPNIGFYYGYLAASELANGKISTAKISIDKAIAYSGDNPYWHLMAALIYQDDEKLHKKHLRYAFTQMPNLREQLANPNQAPTLYIGGKTNDLKIIGFCRKGEDLTLPLPYLESIRD